MNILPIAINPFNNIKISNNNSEKTLKSSVTFQGTAKNAEPLRELMYYGVPGIYSGKYVIPQEIIDNMVSKHVFSKNIRQIVKIMKPYENRLLNVESQFFSIVKNMAKTQPNYSLEDVIQAIAPVHNKRLIKEQVPIFEEISELSTLMPQEQQLEFDRLMDVVCKRINREPAILPFDLKNFKSELHQFLNEYSKKGKRNEFDAMKQIMRIARKMPETPKLADKTSKAKRLKYDKKTTSLVRKRADILTQMELIATSSPLKKNPDLIRLFTQTRAKMYGTPIIIPFNRTSFIEDIQNITNKLEDTKLAHRINQVALKLPTSHESLSAFVMKHLELSSDRIGYNMVAGSSGSIDHLVPVYRNGKDCIENYAITASYFNSERAHRSIEHQLKKYPQAYLYCQKYVDRLVELYNKGVFKKVKLPKHYIHSFAKTMLKLSPKDKPLVLHIDKLK